MKKILCLLLALSVLSAMSACGGQSQKGTNELPPEPTVSQPAEPSVSPQPAEAGELSQKNNILIAYFSLWDNAPWEEGIDTNTSASVVVDENGPLGTNGYVARMIQNIVGGDLHMILAEEPYPADFDAVVDENHRETSRSISSKVENMEQYDMVFIGYPVWAATLPQAVRTFLSEYDFSGKTVIPFCTHDGSGAGRSFSAVAELAVAAETLEGLAIHAPEVAGSADAVTEWLNGLGLSTAKGETTIRITIGEQELEGILYDSSMAQQFIAQLPQTITMSNYGGREVYGGIDQSITVEGEGQLRFDDGDITYCPSNNTAAIFYSQSSNPNLTMTIYPIGKVTSDLSIFPDLPSRVEITFEVMKEAS